MRSKNIQTHPEFAALKAKYGWDEERNRFPEHLPGRPGKRSPLAGVRRHFPGAPTR